MRIEIEWIKSEFGYSGRFVLIHDSENGKKEPRELFTSQQEGLFYLQALHGEKLVSPLEFAGLKQGLSRCPGRWLGDGGLEGKRPRV